MSNELEKIRTEKVAVKERHYLWICMKGSSNHMETIIQNRWCLGTDSNQASAEYKLGVLSLYQNVRFIWTSHSLFLSIFKFASHCCEYFELKSPITR
jgi:hypothetical protein